MADTAGHMKVIVDPNKCQGHARCHAICPEVFEVDAVDQKSRVKLETVPPELEARSLRAVHECPEGAVSLGDEARRAVTRRDRGPRSKKGPC